MGLGGSALARARVPVAAAAMSTVLLAVALFLTCVPVLAHPSPASSPAGVTVLENPGSGWSKSPAVAPLAVDSVVEQVSPEFPVLDSAAARGDQYAPASAFDGTNHLVVWADEQFNSDDPSLTAARVAPDGTVLDLNGIEVTDRFNASFPSVAFDGTDYLVAFQREIQDPVTSQSQFDIYGVRISPAGNVLGSGEFVIGQTPRAQEQPMVEFDGTNFLVAWADGRSTAGTDVYGARVTPSGTVLDPEGLPIATADGDQYPRDIAFNGTDYLIVWDDGLDDSNVVASRVSTAGTVLDPEGIVISTSVGWFSAAGVSVAGPNFLVAWEDDRSPEEPDIYGARVSPGGALLDATGFLISGTAPGSHYRPQVAFDGTNALVVWQSNRSDGDVVQGARVTPDGVVLDPSGLVLATDTAYDPALSFDGSDFLMTWTTGRTQPQESDIYGVRLRGEARLPDGTHSIVSTGSSAKSTDMAFDGTNHLVVWVQVSTAFSDYSIYAARVTPSGTRLDGAGILVANHRGLSLSEPSVTFDGINFLAVWADSRGDTSDLYGARISPSGTVLDPAGIAISKASGVQKSPAVSFDGTNHVVVWQDDRNGENDIYGARVTPAGAVQPIFIASKAVGHQTSPELTSNGAGSLIVWQDARAGSTDVYSTRIGTTGGVVDWGGVRVTAAAGDQTEPSVAWNGTGYVVAWSDQRSGGSGDIYGSRLTASNVVQDPTGIAISAAPDDQAEPSVAASGSAYLVVWLDRRSGNVVKPDIYGGRVDGAGSVLDDAGFAIATHQSPERYPTVATGPAGTWTAVWVRTRNSAGDGSGSMFGSAIAPD